MERHRNIANKVIKAEGKDKNIRIKTQKEKGKKKKNEKTDGKT